MCLAPTRATGRWPRACLASARLPARHPAWCGRGRHARRRPAQPDHRPSTGLDTAARCGTGGNPASTCPPVAPIASAGECADRPHQAHPATPACVQNRPGRLPHAGLERHPAGYRRGLGRRRSRCPLHGRPRCTPRGGRHGNCANRHPTCKVRGARDTPPRFWAHHQCAHAGGTWGWCSRICSHPRRAPSRGLGGPCQHGQRSAPARSADTRPAPAATVPRWHPTPVPCVCAPPGSRHCRNGNGTNSAGQGATR